MKFTKTNSSSLRYFLARLQPFGKLMFWGPLTILGAFCFMIWQYSSHPEWLSQIREQPKTLEDTFIENEDNLLNSESTAPQFNQLPEQQNFDQLPPESNNFNPVTPSPFRENTNPEKRIDSSLLNSGQIPSNQSQKPSSVTPLVPKLNANQPPAEFVPIKPIKPAFIAGENHLQKAITNQSQGEANFKNSSPNSPTSSETLPELPINNRESFSNARPSGQSTNNNYLSQPVQPSIQPYQVPYNNYPTQAQPQPQPQPQPPVSSFQVPYNNYPTQAQPNNFSGQSSGTEQGTSVPSNPSAQPTPQIQPAMREYSPY